MGLDLYIERRKKNDPNAPWEELFYARKFWELLDADFVKEYNDSKNFCYVEARINSEEDFDELINIATHNRNYFGIVYFYFIINIFISCQNAYNSITSFHTLFTKHKRIFCDKSE